MDANQDNNISPSVDDRTITDIRDVIKMQSRIRSGGETEPVRESAMNVTMRMLRIDDAPETTDRPAPASMSNDNDQTQRDIPAPFDSDSDSGRTKIVSRTPAPASADRKADSIAAAGDASESNAPDLCALSGVNLPELLKRMTNIDSRYTFKKAFESGGFGALSKGRDRILSRVVAIKTMHRSLMNDPALVDKFVTEAKLSANLDHPGVVPVYDFQTDPTGGLHILMKYIDGITMKALIHHLAKEHLKHKINQQEEEKALHQRIEQFIRVCEAVDYSHSKNIVHGDLKPENIMIGAFGEVYVMDWGTAALAGTVYRNGVNGTPCYLSPELCRTKMVLKSSDIFALGLILFELATLHQAVEGRTVRETVMRIKTCDFEPLEHVNPRIQIDHRLQGIIRKALESDPAQRYSSPRALLEDLRHFLMNEPLSIALRGDMSDKILRWMYANRTLTFLVFLVFLFLCSGYGFYSMYQRGADEVRSNVRTVQFIKLQHLSDTYVDASNNIMFSLLGRLRVAGMSLSDAVEHSAGRAAAANTKFYYGEDFRDSASAPSDMKFSPVFGKKVSTGHTSIHLLEQLPDGVRDKHLETLASLDNVPRFFGSVLYPGYLADNAMTLPELKTASLHNRHNLLRRTFLTFPGMMIEYPGMSEEFLPPDPRAWYSCDIESMRATGENWLAPYPGTLSDGHYLSCCRILLFDKHKQPYAMLGLEIDLTNLFELIFSRKQAEAESMPASDKYVFGGQYQLIARNLQINNGQGIFKNDSEATAILSQHINLLRLRGERHTEITIRGVRCMISISRIVSIDTTIVQIVPSNKLIQNYHDMKKSSEISRQLTR